MTDILIGVPLGVIFAIAALLWMTRHSHGAESSWPSPENDLEHCDEQWRVIWGNGLDPVWNDNFGWMANGPSVIDKLEAVQAGPLVEKFTVMIQEAGAVRVSDAGGTLEDWDPSAAPFSAVATGDLQALLDDLIAQFDRLASSSEITNAIVQRAQAITNDIDAIRAELDARGERIIERDATGKVVIDEFIEIAAAAITPRAAIKPPDDYPKIGYR